MSVYLNPFYARAAEQHRDAHQFVSTFGAGALDMLPVNAWDRLVLLRSSPGTGKTSLMRLFTPENLEWVRKRTDSTEPVRHQLIRVGAIEEERSLKLGILVDLDRDYRSLLDLPIEAEHGRRLFLRLLDVRILVGVLRSLLFLSDKAFPEDVGAIQFDTAGDSRIEAVIERLGGTSGEHLLEYARATERSILRLLDALLATDIDDIPSGHNELYSLAILASATTSVAGRIVDAQPLVMFDDGHVLERSQRDALLYELRRRQPLVARWYSERFEALSNQEILSEGGQEGRDIVVVNLDTIARQGSSESGRRFLRGKYEQVLSDIARRRAAPTLSRYAQENQGFLDLLEEGQDVALLEAHPDVLQTLEARVLDCTGDGDRYSEWVTAARALKGFRAAVSWREMEVLVRRDQNRQLDLFEEVLSTGDLESRSSTSIREGAALSIAEEFKIPYYAGSSKVLRLGSFNAHQFLGVCGDLFAEMLVDVSLGRPPQLSAERQHRVLREASERYWQAIPRTVPNGRDVQALVREIVTISREEKAKPTMPYPPGVTGTAILMGERQLLLDPEFRAATPGAERLFAALASAVANNILTAELDRSVKNNRYMVLYLNRLLCPRFHLPLGYGAFRERRLQVVIGWMRRLPAERTHPRSQTTGATLQL